MAMTATIERATDRQDELKAPRDRVRLVDVPAHRFVMIDGTGPPQPDAFEARMPGLYGMAYGLRFARKARGIEGKVGPLEGLWWTADGATDPTSIFEGAREDWRWTLMIVLPDDAMDAELARQLEVSRVKLDPSLAADLRIEIFAEGPSAQIMHLGPYAQERPTVERLHAGIAELGLHPTGRHHELYLGDPRRSAPERLRTIVRQPVG